MNIHFITSRRGKILKRAKFRAWAFRFQLSSFSTIALRASMKSTIVLPLPCSFILTLLSYWNVSERYAKRKATRFFETGHYFLSSWHTARSGTDPASEVRGTISVIFGRQVWLRVDYCKGDEVGYTSQYCCDKTTDCNMSHIANAVFWIVQNHGEKSYFCRFQEGQPPLGSALVLDACISA